MIPLVQVAGTDHLQGALEGIAPPRANLSVNSGDYRQIARYCKDLCHFSVQIFQFVVIRYKPDSLVSIGKTGPLRYHSPMARGWESKAVEQHQAETVSNSKTGVNLGPKQRARRKQTLHGNSSHFSHFGNSEAPHPEFREIANSVSSPPIRQFPAIPLIQLTKYSELSPSQKQGLF